MLDVGEVFAERFEIVRVAGGGGMATVYKALDRLNGRVVGLKLLQLAAGDDSQRFQREAALLARLSHPAIVRHLDHGVSPEGVWYLVMEWLDGENLAARLAREALTPRETIALARRAASALVMAHGRGVIHRDIKPGNLFLVGGDPRQVKVLDFGIARPALASVALTRSGAMVGTLGYIAPEQACGELEIDERVDVFSLGCVLFECLTGEAAFKGARPVAVLAKILFGDVPRVRDLRPELPAALDAVVARLMARDRDGRPRDAVEVLAALDIIDPQTGATPVPLGLGPAQERTLTADEQRFLSVILVSPRGLPAAGEAEAAGPANPWPDDAAGRLRRAAEPLGGQLVPLAAGDVLVTLRGSGTARDLAARAATCALALHAAAPDAQVCLATGALEIASTAAGAWPAGQVIDRVAALQGASELTPACDAGPVRLDDVTAALLDARFQVLASGPGRVLLGVADESPWRSAGARRLLGKPTPCVGRERELAFLASVFDDCACDAAASVVLVTGPAGSGKTRLASEFAARLQGGPEPARVVTAAGDPVYAGTAFGLAAQLVRDAVGLPPASLDPPALRHAALRRSLAASFEGAELQRVAELLGELVQAPATEAPSPRLLAARNDPRFRNVQLRAAFVDWLGALCAERPLVLVLDNLHWGDPSSVGFIHDALRHFADARFMVVALARPEVVDAFPGLWSDVGLQRLGLGGLSRRAASALVRTVLGPGLSEDIVRRTVEQAGGNAFFLEELIRRVAERGDVDFPDSVLAMAQSRLEGLDAEGRRVLRAASVFGRVFWEGAVAALVGDALAPEALGEWLDALIDAEILEPSRVSKFPGHRELVFHHDLLREAAYAMLTESDRQLGHRLAARWLVQAGEPEAIVIADHFEKGGQTLPAIPYLVHAASAAFNGGDLETTHALTERALGYGASGHDRGRLLMLQGSQGMWRGDFLRLAGAAREALDLLTPGSAEWYMALAQLAFGGSFGGDGAAMMQAATTLRAFRRDVLPPTAPVGYAAFGLTVSFIFMGQADEARLIQRRLVHAIDRTVDPDSLFLAFRHMIGGWLSFYGLSPAGCAVPESRSALRHLEDTPSPLAGSLALYSLGVALLSAGDLARSEQTLDQVISRCRETGTSLIERWALCGRATIRTHQRRFDEALALLTPLATNDDLTLAATARLGVAAAHAAAGRFEEAALHASGVRAAAGLVPMRQAEATAVLAAASLRLGRPRSALAQARQSLAQIDRVGASVGTAAAARLIVVEALEALGDRTAAADALRQARAAVLADADSFDDPALRASFLENLEPNARVVALAAERLREA